MIDLVDAIALVEANATPLPPRRQRLLDACGQALAEPVVSDVDSPPWDRAMCCPVRNVRSCTLTRLPAWAARGS